MRGGIAKKDGCGTLYVKDRSEMFRKMVVFCEKMILCSVQSEEMPRE